MTGRDEGGGVLLRIIGGVLAFCAVPWVVLAAASMPPSDPAQRLEWDRTQARRRAVEAVDRRRAAERHLQALLDYAPPQCRTALAKSLDVEKGADAMSDEAYRLCPAMDDD